MSKPLKFLVDRERCGNHWQFPSLIISSVRTCLAVIARYLGRGDHCSDESRSIGRMKHLLKGKETLEEGLESYFGRNEYLDSVLPEFFRTYWNRRIVFASFDPDTCIL